MVLIIVCAIILAVFCAFEDGEAMFAFFGLFMGGMLGFMLAMFVGLVALTGTTAKTTTKPLPALVDNNGVSGQFFLGSGYVENSPTYSWYEETAPDTFVRRDVDTDEATIHYIKDGDRPHYLYTAKVTSDAPFLGAFWLNLTRNVVEDEHYDFYVPRGTITNDFKLDAQG